MLSQEPLAKRLYEGFVCQGDEETELLESPIVFVQNKKVWRRRLLRFPTLHGYTKTTKSTTTGGIMTAQRDRANRARRRLNMERPNSVGLQ